MQTLQRAVAQLKEDIDKESARRKAITTERANLECMQ